ncbi:hypothetical protein BDN72DRAFT_905849 [Pluteus cervinus]|uniref:Uncharacterized protein n=1 Tax=Pluteus cervinus TaxID=181527 RepID=A0ACD3A0W1_9AGAR|nr:hypothetical protein BDN72DRAFT_905849 [Pluteus cervinus]
MASRQPNQYRPTPPLETIKDKLIKYWGWGRGDQQIAELLEKDYNTEVYGMSAKSVQRARKVLGLKGTRQQKHTEASIAPHVREIKKRFPVKGVEGMRKTLFAEMKVRAPRSLISQHLHHIEPDAITQRKSKKFKRAIFYAAGVNHVWAMDQHDKWGKYGLWLHNGIEPFSGMNLWLKVWWTNRNPRLIAKYYLEATRKLIEEENLAAIPMITQSDPGTENFGVANLQTIIRHKLDPSLEGTIQHKWKRSKMNIKSEGNWSVIRREFSVGFENLFEWGVQEGLYNVDNPLHSLVFRWVFIPYIQAELDSYAHTRNTTAPRRQRHKIIPQGVPEMIQTRPDVFGCKDFKIIYPEDWIGELEQQFADPTHEVFQLTPPLFHERAAKAYLSLDSPIVNYDTAWGVYRGIVQIFERSEPNAQFVELVNGTEEQRERVNDDKIDLIPSVQKGLDRLGKWVPGGDWIPEVAHEDTDEEDDNEGILYADFTSEEED